MTTRFAPTRVALAAVAAVALILSATGIASAHASLDHANIKPGEVFQANAYPRTLTGFFAENVKPSSSFLHVFEADPKGDHAMVDTGKNSFPFKNPKEIVATLPKGLKGVYTVMWYTVSADDGHTAGFTFNFTVK